MKIKNKLQEIADRTDIARDFRAEVKKLLKLRKLDRQQGYYLCKKYDIKTKFRRGRPERKFD